MSEREGDDNVSGRGKDEPIVSRKAFIGTLSALAFTTGLTIALIPAYKRNRLRAARQAGQALRTVSPQTQPKRTSLSGLGTVAAGQYKEKREGAVGRLPDLPRGESSTSSRTRTRPGPLDGLLGSPASSSADATPIASSSKAPQGSSTRTGPKKAGPLDGLLAADDAPPAAVLAARERTSAEIGSKGSMTGMTSPGRGMGVLGGLAAGSTSTVAAGSSHTPTTITSPSSTTTTSPSPSPSPNPISTSIPTSTPTSPEELEPVPPQISYFSLTPADPYSDEEDAHGFPLDEPAEGELAEGEEGEISPWFAAKAFGIATALVVGGAGVIMVGVGKGLGVRDMDEFTAKMRGWTQKTLPELQEQIFKPLPSEPSETDVDHLDNGRPRIGFTPVPPASPSAVIGTGRKRTKEDEEEEGIVSGWWEGVVEGAEEERKGRERVR